MPTTALTKKNNGDGDSNSKRSAAEMHQEAQAQNGNNSTALGPATAPSATVTASTNVSGTSASNAPKRLTVEFNVNGIENVDIADVYYDGADNGKATNEKLKEFVKN